MKKITLIFLASLLSFTGFSQVEGFEGATFPPTGWAVHDNGIGLVQSWSTITGATNVYAGDKAAYLNRENVTNGTFAQDWLVTPFTVVPTNPQLRFFTKQTLVNNQGSIYTIRVSTTSQTDQSTFTTIQTWTEDEMNAAFNVYEEKVVSLASVTSLPGYTGSIYIAFVMTNDNGDRWLIDNVSVVEQCLDPTGLTATNIGLNSATLSWANPSGAPQFEVELVPSGSTPTGTGTIVPSNSITATTLMPNTGTPLLPATAYQYYVKALCATGTYSEWIGPFDFTTKSPGETCNAPILISDLPYTTSGTTAGFGDDYSGSPGSSGCGTTSAYLNGDDIFYSFTATSNNSITITSQTNTTWSGLFVYTSCANVGVSCVAGHVGGNGSTTPDTVTFTPVVGQTYYIAISTFGSGATQSTNFNLTIVENTCTNMTANFAVVSNCASGTDSFFVTANVTNMGSAASIVGVTNPVSTTETITAAGTMQFGPFPNGTDVTINLQNAADDNCFRNSSVLTQAFCPATNNLCSGAIPVTCGSTFTQTTVGATTAGAFAATCGTGPGSGGLWYSFVGNGDVVTFSLCGSQYDTKIQVLTGSCGAFTCVAGNDDSCGDQSEVQVTTVLGTTYYIYVYGFGTAQGVFTLNTTCITPPPPPANDNCNTAITVPVNTDGTCALTTAGTVSGATPSPQANACAGSADDDVWYSFVATQSSHTIELLNIAGSNLDLNHVVYTSTNTADLCGTLTQVFCSNPNFSVITGLTAGQTYFIRVYTAVNTPLQDTTFSLCVSVPPPPPANDECANATVAPVNSGSLCTQTINGTITSSTASPQPNACGGTDDDDVWFQFTATNTSHIVTFSNITGTVTDLNFVVYSGNCNSLTQEVCNTASNSSPINNLIPGTTYYIRVYSATGVANQFMNFTLCISSPSLSISTNLYTAEQLVQDVLVNSDCALISNITYQTSTSSISHPDSGIAYFQENAPGTLPFPNGVILSTGFARNASGETTAGTLSDNIAGWGGDPQLLAYMQSLGFSVTNYNNASILEFDFIPLHNEFNFDFMFLSDEYGTFQCTYPDAFAFFLTNTETNQVTNLAFVPGTTDPISVLTVRNSLYNTGCPSANEQYFDVYNGPTNSIDDPTNFNGQTTLMTATANVVPNTVYHMKLVIADRNDTAFDSAVFLSGDSFNVGDLELGNDILEQDGNAICEGDSYVINSGLDPNQYNITWSNQNGIIPGETGPTLTVNEEGVYTVTAGLTGSSCTVSDNITIEFYPSFNNANPIDLVNCNASGFATFDLTENNSTILNGQNSALFTINYYLSEQDALDEVNSISNASTFQNTVQYNQQIWVRIDYVSSSCYKVLSFNLTVQDLTPQFSISPDFGLCVGQSGSIVVTPINYSDNQVVYSWSDGSSVLADTDNTLDVSSPGTYIVTINNSGCIATDTVVVSLTPSTLTPTFNIPNQICFGDVAPLLPSLSNDSTPFTGSWSPSTVDTSSLGTTTYTFTPDTGQCALPYSIDITVNALPLAPTLTTNSPICSGSDAIFTITGAANATITLTGASSPVVLDGSGVATVTIPGVTSNTSITLTNISNGVCDADINVTSEVQVNALPLAPTITTNSPICSGSDAIFTITGAANATLTVTGVAGPVVLDGSGVATVTISGVTSNTSIEVTNVFDGSCNSTVSVISTVQVNALPTVTAVTTNSPICNGTTAEFTVTGTPNSQLSYSLNGVAQPAISIGSTGVATISINNVTTTQDLALTGILSNGCTSALTQTAQVLVTPIPSLDPLGDQVACDSYPLPTLQANNSYYTGSNGTGTMLAVGTPITTSQTIYILASSGTTPNCTAERSFTVTITDSPEVTLEGGCEGASYLIHATVNTTQGVTYKWFNSQGVISGATDATLVVTQDGTYSCQVTLASGLACESDQEIFIANGTLCTVQKGISPNGDGLNEEFDLTGLNVKKLHIYNRYGVEVYSYTNYTNQWHGQTDKGEELPSGTYYYVMELDGQESKSGWIYINR